MISKNKVRTAQEIKSFRIFIITCSILFPVIIGMLTRVKVEGYDFSILPHIYASINGITSLVLISALIAVKKRKIGMHQTLMKTAMLLSILFLVLYVVYHITADSTPYQGSQATLYYSILISHILLSSIIIPFVLLTFFQAWKNDFEKHKKWARITFPLWLYVTLSGVAVYVMISPYY